MLLPLPLTFPLPPSSPYVRWGWERVASSQLLCISCAFGCDVTEVVIEAGHVLRSRGTYDRAALLLRVKAESRCGLSLIIFWSITLNKQATFLGEGKKKKNTHPAISTPNPNPNPSPISTSFFFRPVHTHRRNTLQTLSPSHALTSIVNGWAALERCVTRFETGTPFFGTGQCDAPKKKMTLKYTRTWQRSPNATLSMSPSIARRTVPLPCHGGSRIINLFVC